ncbi:MAG: cellobiose system component [Chloroflexota bacterium]|nr:cellobiose system component [Chloroflexota bacterium]
MEKLMERIQTIVLPISEKLSANKYLSAVTETLQILMPITVIGSFATLFAFIDIGPWQSFLESNPMVRQVFQNIGTWTLNSFALYVAAVLPYRYAEKHDMKEAPSMIPLTLAVFIIFSQATPYTPIPTDFLGARGLFSALILGYAVPATCKLFIDKNISIKMPAGVPKFIEATFAVLIPAIVVLSFAGIVSQIISTTQYGTVHNMIYTIIQVPLQGIGLSFPSLLLVEIVMTLLMFTGIHGGVALTYIDPLIMAANAENMAAMAAGQPMPNILTRGLMNSIQAGGIGATLGLGLVLFFVAKSERFKTLSRVAIVPQLFNISEPLLFGVPIVLNPLLFIPYIGGVVINTFVVYGAVYFGIIGKFTGVDVNWTIPMVLQGILSHSNPVVGGLFQAGIVALDALIWYPFVKIMDKQALEEEALREQA